jgi:hypothetical protein
MSRMSRRTALPALLLALVATLGGCTPYVQGGSSPSVAVTPQGTAGTGIVGRVHAGPVCPVSRPGDSACADRPVAGAVLVVTSTAGTEVATTTSAADGTFGVALPPGDYILVPGPVEGLLGTARPIPFHVSGDGGPRESLDVAYDTGIR